MTTKFPALVNTLKAHTQALALPNGRMVGHPGHEEARLYLAKQMERFELTPFSGNRFELPYERPHPNTGEPTHFTNLAGVIHGTDRSLPPLLLGAHYDSVIDAPCVDDNATSVALNLAIAEEFVARPLRRDLIIAFFDAEEPPYFLGQAMGSRRFCEDYCQDLRFAAVLVSDLIGHDLSVQDFSLPGMLDKLFPHLRKLLFVMGSESNSALPGILEKTASKARGIRVVPTLHEYVGPMSDHAAFADQGQPFLFFSCGQGKHYHSREDTMDWINFRKLGRITEFIAELLERIDEEPPEQASAPPCDPFEMEIRMLKEAIGPVFPFALKQLKLKEPTNREELNELVSPLVNRSLS